MAHAHERIRLVEQHLVEALAQYRIGKDRLDRDALSRVVDIDAVIDGAQPAAADEFSDAVIAQNRAGREVIAGRRLDALRDAFQVARLRKTRIDDLGALVIVAELRRLIFRRRLNRARRRQATSGDDDGAIVIIIVGRIDRGAAGRSAAHCVTRFPAAAG
jgi:hypothetical protein